MLIKLKLTDHTRTCCGARKVFSRVWSPLSPAHVTGLGSWLHFNAEYYSTVWVHHTLFIHSPIEEYLSYF